VTLLNRELTQQAKEHRQEVQSLSDRHAAQIRSLQSSLIPRRRSSIGGRAPCLRCTASCRTCKLAQPPPAPECHLRCLLHRRLHRRFSTDLQVRQTNYRRMQIGLLTVIQTIF
ncbi:hypothetical protein PIB30_095247, partial [Stylosanthes scabra]|nr:hypothetical protein [Stylosanthes scabra]